MDRDLYRHILAMTGLPQTGEFEGLVDEFADSMRERCGAPIVPGELESLGFSVMKPKTAALAFDRIYRIPLLSDPVPPQIGFYCGTLPEVAYWVGIFALTVEIGRASCRERV